MDTIKLINELRTERQNIDEAISVLTRLAQGSGKRRGQPPKWLGNSTPAKRVFTAETRARMSAAQRKRRKGL